MGNALFLVGAPGVGKTAIARDLLGFPDVRICPKPKWTLSVCSEIAAAGHYTGGAFDGADTVGYGDVAKWLDFWEVNLAPYCVLTIFDGDRFSHASALARVAVLASVLCVHLVLGPEALAARRAERGSDQNAAWMKGRATKSERFAALCSRSIYLDARHAPGVLANIVRGAL